MTAQVRKAAQRWYPPKTYTHNAKESKNYALKDWMEFRKNSIVVWIIFVKQVDIWEECVRKLYMFTGVTLIGKRETKTDNTKRSTTAMDSAHVEY